MAKIVSNPYLKALERYNQKVQQRSQKELSIQNVIEEKLGDYTYLQDQKDEDYEGQLNDIIEEINNNSLKLQHEATKRKMGAAKQLGGSILTASKQKELSSRIHAYSRSSNVQLGAYSEAALPTGKLEGMITSKAQGLANLTEKMKSLIDPNTGEILDEQRFKQYAGTSGRLEKEIAKHQLSMKYQRDMGLDPIGVVSSAQSISDRAEKILEKDKINKDAISGKFGSLQQESDLLAKKLKTLQDAIDGLNKATDAERDIKQKLVQHAKEDVKRQIDIVNTVGRNGGGASSAEKFSRLLKDFGKIVSSFSSGYGQIAIQNPLHIMQNQTRYMNMYNDRYSTMQNMTKGDQLAFLKTMGMYGGASNFSNTFLGKGQTYMETKLGAAGLNLAGDAIVGGAKIAGAYALTGGVGAGFVGADVAGDLSAGVANVASMYSDVRNNITAGRIGADAYDRYKDMFQALNAIPANQMQANEDQYRRSYKAGIGLGINNKIENSLINYSKNSILRELSSLNVSPERAAMLTSLGGQTVGGRDLSMSAIKSAAQAERAGVVSAEQYMQMLGGVTDVGGKSGDLYNILKQAVKSGMDDSKSISRMVSATVSIADKSSTATGMITSPGVGEAVLRASNFSNTMMTTSQKAKVGASAATNISNLLSRGGTDIYSLQELASITEATRGTTISQQGRINLEKAGLSEMSLMQDLLGDESSSRYKRAAESLSRIGLGDLVGNKQAIKGILSAKGRTAAQRVMGLGTQFTQEARDYIQGVFSGETKVNSFSDFESTLSKISKTSLNEFRARASTEKIPAEALFNVLQGKHIVGANLAPSVSRAVKAAKISTQGEREFWESEQGRNKILSATGYDAWEKQRAAAAAATLMPGSGASPEEKYNAQWFQNATEEEKKQKFHDSAQSRITQYIKSATAKEVYKEHTERTESAGKLQAPGAILDASKEFKSAAAVFGKTVNGDFKDAIKEFKSAVTEMNKLSSRASTVKEGVAVRRIEKMSFAGL